MGTTIVCFYIECADQAELEKVLRQAGYAHYDATEHDELVRLPTRPPTTLEDIECALEGK